MSWNANEPMVSWGGETPLETQQRLREQQDHEQRAREVRAAAEQERQQRQPAYAPPPDPRGMGPLQLQAWREQQQVINSARAAEEEEVRRKDRALRAFIESGGSEAEFEEAYPSLRKRMINAETM